MIFKLLSEQDETPRFNIHRASDKNKGNSFGMSFDSFAKQINVDLIERLDVDTVDSSVFKVENLDIGNQKRGNRKYLVVKFFNKDPEKIALNFNNLKLVRDRRESFGDFAKFLPTVYEVGHVSDYDSVSEARREVPYALIELLEPIPDSMKKYFHSGDPVQWNNVGEEIISDPQLLEKITIRTAIDFISEDIAKEAGKIITKPMFSVDHKITIKVENIAKTSKTFSILPKSLKKLSAMIYQSIVDAADARVRQIDAEIAYRKEKDATRESMISEKDYIDFILKSDLLRSVMMNISMQFQSRGMVPSTLGKDVEKYRRSLTGKGVDPVVDSIISAMEYFRSVGFNPFDLHIDNFMIRPESGDIVFSDFGRFNIPKFATDPGEFQGPGS
jgi:hypothetical protein